METSLMRHSNAIAARAANSTALRFSTGKAPGSPRHTGHKFVLGGSPKRVEHEQKIFDAVSNCTWTSSPMTGSSFARRSSETAGVVAIPCDYSWPRGWSAGRPRPATMLPTSDSLSTKARRARTPVAPSNESLWSLGFRRAQVLLHRNFEIHQLIAFRVAHSHQVEVGASQRIRDVGDIEKQEATRTRMRFHRLGDKLSLLDFVPRLAVHAPFYLFAWQRNRNRQPIRPVIPRRTRQPAQQIVHGRREQLAAIFGIQLVLQSDERDGLIAIIRDYKEDRHVTVVAVVNAEDRGFVLYVIRIDCDRNFLRAVVIVCRVSAGGLRRGHRKLFSRNRAKTAQKHKSAECRITSDRRHWR